MKILKPSRKKNHKSEDKAQSIIDQSVKDSVSSPASLDANNDLDLFSGDFESTAALDSASNITGTSSKPGGGKKTGNKKSKKSDYDFLMHKAIHLLSMREHSVQELQTKLYAKTEALDIADSVMAFLLENDYVSDSRFTEAFIRSRANKGHGPIKIKTDLKGKGVNIQIVDEYLNPDAGSWYDNAENLYKKKYGDKPVSDYNDWSKRARFMQGRGFTMEHIHSTVPQVNYD